MLNIAVLINNSYLILLQPKTADVYTPTCLIFFLYPYVRNIINNFHISKQKQQKLTFYYNCDKIICKYEK